MDKINLTEKDSEIQQSTNKTRSKAALTIVIYSWATPIIGVLMMVVGLVGGFLVRPLLLPQSSQSVTASGSGVASSSDASTNPPDQPANAAEMMAYVVSQTRHFIGDSNAPVTIIEFGDFQ